jgi:hypothetical protein
MENRDLRKALDILNSISATFMVATLVLVLGFGNKIERWQTYRDLQDEALYLQKVGVKPSPATDLVYKRLCSCYYDTAGLTGAEPVRFCADAAASIATTAARQEDRQDVEKLIDRMKSDLH